MRWMLLACLCGCGFERRDMPPPPRLIAPLSTAFVNTLSPTLRFTLPPNLTRPIVELSRSRAFDGAIVGTVVDGIGRAANPASPLDPGLWYWRVRADSPMGEARSVVWQMRVANAAAPRELSTGSSLDLDGDGFDELAVGAPSASTTDDGIVDGRVYVYRGGPNGPDPAQVTVLESPVPSAQFGHGLAAVDYDGDGFVDLAVGAPSATEEGAPSGAVYLYRGGPNGIGAKPSQVLAFTSADDFGWMVDSAGDFNGDGFGDVVIGAPTTVFGGNVTGAAYVFYGAGVGTGQFTSLLPESDNFVATGLAVAGGGDVDGDGLGDVVVGVPNAQPGGRAWLYRGGAAKGDPLLLDASAPVDSKFGFGVTLLGDRDGDGIGDLAVGSPMDGPGRVHVFSGRLDARPVLQPPIDGPDGDGGRFGISLVGGGDANGDGLGDLAVTATCAPNRNLCEGRAYLVVGTTATAFSGAGESFGMGLALGDHDGDGKVDLAAATGDYDNLLGRMDWFRGSDPADRRIFTGSDPTGRFGFALR